MKGRKKMQLQRLLSYTRKAVDEFSMIQEGDHIAVGISGGKRQPYPALCASWIKTVLSP